MYLHNSIDNGLDGGLDVAFTGDHEESVLEVPAQSRVGVGAAQNHVVLSVKALVFGLELPHDLVNRFTHGTKISLIDPFLSNQK